MLVIASSRSRTFAPCALQEIPSLKKDCFGATPKPAREPRALPGTSARSLLVIPSGAKRSRGISRATLVSTVHPRVVKQILLRVPAVFSEVTFRELPQPLRGHFPSTARNNAASTRARSRHRSGMLAAAHTQKASRNLQSSAPRLATRRVLFGARHQTTPTTPRDPPGRSRRAGPSHAGVWRDSQACIRVIAFPKLVQVAAAKRNVYTM